MHVHNHHPKKQSRPIKHLPASQLDICTYFVKLFYVEVRENYDFSAQRYPTTTPYRDGEAGSDVIVDRHLTTNLSNS